MESGARNLLVALAIKLTHWISLASPLLDLGLRLWVARVFWNSGMSKIQS